MKKSNLTLLTGLAVLSTSTAMAQALPDSALSTASPGRISEQLQRESVAPRISPEITVNEADIQAAPRGAENINLNLNGLNIRGVTAYDETELSSIYRSSIGQTITLADVYAIANRIKLKYRNDGYLLTQVVVPPQTIDNGLVDLQVVEGTVDSIVIQGEETPATDLIRQYANEMSLGGPLNSEQLERQLLLINDLPGVTARSVLSPSPNLTGAADLRIIVERDPYDALVGINNYGSRYLGQVQASAAGTINNVFDMNDSLTAQVVVAPDDYELGYYALSYMLPINKYGTRLNVFGSHTDTDPGFDLAQFDVEGQSVFASVSLEHPFIRSRAQNLYGRVLFDWRDAKTTNNLPEATREDNIRALRLGARYDFIDTLLGVGVNALDVEFAHGLDVFGASDRGDNDLTRADGEPDFFKVNAEIQRLQRVTNGVNLLLAGQGQWSDDKLLSSEEFGVGGINIGRAYDPSEIIGDKGIAGKVELQWNDPVEWSAVDGYQLFTFFDAGRVWNEDATTNDQKRESATSTGFGIRTEFMDDVNADFAVAFPLNRDVDTQGDDDARLYFSLTKGF